MKKDNRFFSVKQATSILFDATYMMAKYGKFLKKISKKFRSNIMLAVTNVNGCRYCSYYHTQELIKEGATTEEMQALMDGSFKDIEAHETLALVFAQHYADADGNYDKDAFKKVVEYYGKDTAYGIMATIKLIMFGNMNGISIGNLVDRIKFKKPSNSKFFTDLYNGLFAYVLLFIFLIINLFRKRKEFAY